MATLLILCMSASALGGNVDWIGADDDNWDVGANWDPAGVPGSAAMDVALVGNGTSPIIDSDLTPNSGLTGIYVHGGSNLQVQPGAVLDNSASPGGGLYLAHASTYEGDGTITQTGGSVIWDGQLIMGGTSPGGNSRYEISGGSLTVGASEGTFQHAHLPMHGSGELIINGGTVSINDDVGASAHIYVGQKAGASGLIQVNGGELSMQMNTPSAILYIGGGDGADATTSGTLEINGGSTTVGGFMRVGSNTAAGTLTVTDGSLTVVGILDIPSGGTATATQSGGTVTSELNFRLARLSGDEATYTMAGGTFIANWDYWGAGMDIGKEGTGEFIQQDGLVDAEGIILGRSGGSGTYRLQGGTLKTRNGTATSGSCDALGKKAGTGTALFDWTGGTLEVEGTVNLEAALVNAGGTLAPGASAGQVDIVGGYQVTSPDAALAIEIGGLGQGTEYDFVNVSAGATVLGGDLLVEMLGGFEPDPANTFTVLSSPDGLSGAFGNVASGSRLDTGGGVSFLVSYDGSDVVLSEYLAMLLMGDANGDGCVGIADLSALADNYGATGATWKMGDFNDDGEVGIADLSALADNYGEGSGCTDGSPVPEPATLGLLAIGGLALIRRRN